MSLAIIDVRKKGIESFEQAVEKTKKVYPLTCELMDRTDTNSTFKVEVDEGVALFILGVNYWGFMLLEEAEK